MVCSSRFGASGSVLRRFSDDFEVPKRSGQRSGTGREGPRRFAATRVGFQRLKKRMEIATPRTESTDLGGLGLRIWFCNLLGLIYLSIDLLLVALIIRVCSSKFGSSEAVERNVPRSMGLWK